MRDNSTPCHIFCVEHSFLFLSPFAALSLKKVVKLKTCIQKTDAEVLKQCSWSVICLFSSSTGVQPWLQIHSSSSPLSTRLPTQPLTAVISMSVENRMLFYILKLWIFPKLWTAELHRFGYLVVVFLSGPHCQSSTLLQVLLIPYYEQFHKCCRYRAHMQLTE